MTLNKFNEKMSDDEFEELKQDIEDSLIELVDEGYRVVVVQSPYFTNRIPVIVAITIKDGVRNQDIKPIKEYLHQLYDLMEYHKYSLNKVDVSPTNYDTTRNVRLLDKKTGKVSLEDDIHKAEDFESVWDSIDFCIFSSRGEPDKFYRINLLFS
jgi:hypothetical protein